MTYTYVFYKYIKFVYIDTHVQIKYIIYKSVGHIYVCVYTESKRNEWFRNKFHGKIKVQNDTEYLGI